MHLVTIVDACRMRLTCQTSLPIGEYKLTGRWLTLSLASPRLVTVVNQQ